MVRFRWAASGIAAILLMVVTSQLMAAELSSLRWQTDYAVAHQQRVRDGRPMLVFVTMDGCPFCDKMLQTTYANAKVRATIHDNFVPTFVNGSEQRELAKQFGVRIYPTTFLIGPDNRILEKVEGFMEPAVFQRKMASITQRLAAQPVSAGSEARSAR
jgi:thioredoxin-related protein